MRNLVPFLFLAFLAGMLGAVLISSYPSTAEDKQASDAAFSEEAAMVAAIKKLRPCVVAVVPTRDLPLYQSDSLDFDDDYYESLIFGGIAEPYVMTSGSGFLVHEDAWVLTSAHVVDNEDLLYSAILNDGQTFQVSEIVFADEGDMALLHLQNKQGDVPSGLPIARLVESYGLEAGQKVIAVGSFPGSLGQTVSSGIISALNRSIRAIGLDGEEDLVHLIQTDSAIQPGSSGGPLANLQGEVIGMSTAVTTDGGNMGFAIPSNDLLAFIAKELAL